VAQSEKALAVMPHQVFNTCGTGGVKGQALHMSEVLAVHGFNPPVCSLYVLAPLSPVAAQHAFIQLPQHCVGWVALVAQGRQAVGPGCQTTLRLEDAANLVVKCWMIEPGSNRQQQHISGDGIQPVRRHKDMC